MELKKEKLVRFYCHGKEQKNLLWGTGDPSHLQNSSSGSKIPLSSLKTEGGFRGLSTVSGTFKFGRSNVFPDNGEPWRKRILNPGSEIMLQWNRIFTVTCLLALFIDPLYFYPPSIGGTKNSKCMETELNLGIVVTCFWTIADCFYLLHVIIKFRTAYVAPSSRVFGRGELVMDPKKIARRYVRSDFFIDLIAALPLPQPKVLLLRRLQYVL